MKSPSGYVVLIYGCAIFAALLLVLMTFAGGQEKSLEHADLVLNEKGCEWLRKMNLFAKDSTEPKTCRLEDVSVSSRGVEGQSGFLGVTEIPGHDGEGYSVREDYVLWIEDNSDGVPVRISAAAFGD